MIARVYGAYLRKLRIQSGASLRGFARKIGMDPSNLCRIENGSSRPPTAKQQLRIAEALELPATSTRFRRLMDLAAVERKELPADVQDSILDVEIIPTCMCDIKGKKLRHSTLTSIHRDLERMTRKGML